MDLARPRRLTRVALNAVRTVPRLGTVLTELRDAARQIERLATFAAQELPEVVYQLELIRGQLAAIERRFPPARSVEAGDEAADGIHREALREAARGRR